eukprot:gene25212-28502_t
MTGLLTIAKSDVPLYLQKGSRFQSIDREQNTIADVPINALKADTTLDNLQDFKHLLESLQFWKVDDELYILYDFILNQPISLDLDNSIALAPEEFSSLAKLYQIKKTAPEDTIAAAIRVNEEKIVHYLDTRGYEWPSGATALAAELGHLDILRYAAGTNRAPGSTEIMLAVANGHVDCLKFIYELSGCRDKYRLVTECVRHGQLECLQYVHSVGLVDKEENLCAVAVTHRHLPILSYLLSIGCSIYEDCASLAACQWSLQHTCVGDSVFVWFTKDPGNAAAAPQELSSLPYIYNPVESLCDTVSFLHFYSGLANAVAVGLL